MRFLETATSSSPRLLSGTTARWSGGGEDFRHLGIGIVPDIIIGKDIEKELCFKCITLAERASEKKFWRNVGEYVDARNALGGKTLIVTITFDSGQKRKLSTSYHPSHGRFS